jgi:DNA-binding CsgD family transcriptional regulator
MRKRRRFLNERLSAREIECLAWAAQGKTYREISMLVGLSFASVKTYLDTARFKLGAVNLPHAVALAITYGKIFMKEEAVKVRHENAERYYGEMGTIR